METSGREFALKFHGLDSGDPRVRERFRTICLDHLELTDQQALDILTARATRVLCTDIAPETLQTVARSLQEIGIRVDIAESLDEEQVQIPGGSFSTDHDATFAESQLFERVTPVRRYSDESVEGYASGFVEEFFSQDKHYGLFSIQDAEASVSTRRNRHATFLSKGRTLSLGERVGLALVACLLVALVVILVRSSREPLASRLPSVSAVSAPVSDAASSPPLNIDQQLSTASFEGATKGERTTLSLKWNTIGKTSSVRLILDTASPDQSEAAAERELVTFSRAESDPTFLVQESDGSWHGEAPVYFSAEAGGETRKLTGVARFTVSPAQDASGALAEVSILYPRDGGGVGGERPTLEEGRFGGFTFSLHETVQLRPSSGS